MTTIQLTKPISAHGAELTALELREPTVPEIRKHGIPLSFQTDGSMSINAAAALSYLSVLAGIPPSSVDQMHPADITSACISIIPFFTGSAV